VTTAAPACGVRVRLRDDRTVVVHPIDPSDADALVRFHEGLSLETTRLRFFSPHPHLDPQEVERFCGVDHVRREALVAWSGTEIVGVARYEACPDAGTGESWPDDVEVAFVVADGWHGVGLGSELLRLLAERARSAGVHHLVADTLFENRAMVGVFEHSGLAPTHQLDGGVLHYVMDLDRPS
jgi:GNAT superfamily N-acetyltransferase